MVFLIKMKHFLLIMCFNHNMFCPFKPFQRNVYIMRYIIMIHQFIQNKSGCSSDCTVCRKKMVWSHGYLHENPKNNFFLRPQYSLYTTVYVEKYKHSVVWTIPHAQVRDSWVKRLSEAFYSIYLTNYIESYNTKNL